MMAPSSLCALVKSGDWTSAFQNTRCSSAVIRIAVCLAARLSRRRACFRMLGSSIFTLPPGGSRGTSGEGEACYGRRFCCGSAVPSPAATASDPPGGRVQKQTLKLGSELNLATWVTECQFAPSLGPWYGRGRRTRLLDGSLETAYPYIPHSNTASAQY